MNNSIFNGAREFYSFHTQVELCVNIKGEWDFLLLLISMEILSEFGAYLYENICDIKNHELNFLFSREEFMNLN